MRGLVQVTRLPLCITLRLQLRLLLHQTRLLLQQTRLQQMRLWRRLQPWRACCPATPMLSSLGSQDGA